MTPKVYDVTQLFDDYRAFFELKGSVNMLLTADAAQEVCNEALKYNLLVIRAEGGIWHHPGFEARLDSIWDGRAPPLAKAHAETNNRKAAESIREDHREMGYNVFIITALSNC